MIKKEFKTSIDATPEKVWDILWGEKTYPDWTSVFAEGSKVEDADSNAVTKWNEGSKIYFLDGKGSGMVSVIAANRPNEFMSFKHMGTVNNGKEDLDSPQTKEWAGSHENYTLKKVDGKTELLVEMDVTDEYKDYFNNTWPLAMERLKKLAEIK